MSLYKRIISLFLVFAICISSMVTVAFAADEQAIAPGFTQANFSSVVSYGAAMDEVFGYLSGASGYLGTLREAMSTGSCAGCTVNPDGRHNFLPVDVLTTSWAAVLKGGEACICRYCGISYDEFYNSTYNQYVSSLQTDLGTTTLIDGGIRLYYIPTAIKPNMNKVEVANVSEVGVVPVTGTLYAKSTSAPYCSFTFENMYAPFDAKCVSGLIIETLNCKWSNSNVEFTTGVYTGSERTSAEGDLVMWTLSNQWTPALSINGSSGADCYFSFVAYNDLYPIEENYLPGDFDLSVNSRPASITGDYGIIGDDGTIIHVEGNMIVDESTNTVYNPVTNTTNNYTDYAFDYSDRSYNLTLEDGSTLKVVYGDENITIHEGDTIYNVYYIIEGGSGSGETPGTDTGSGWTWLQGAWTQMLDKLTQIKEAITGLNMSPDINVDVEVNEGEEQETQESWFSKLLSKFSFLTSLHDIYAQLIADVTSDAATAAAIADGEIMLADVTSGHAATDGSTSYTAPEMAIAFGPSDKYGVDWANIKPLDLSWYAPHKETVDGILSGILWLSYLFLLIKRAPGIIRGSEMVTEDRIKIDMWRRRH